ncbi:ammonia-dependent NAD(+) synthetase [Ligilactobacillus ceti]|uniref:NH(3)-dependent NAD(+) synthetase n=1 Tax=Ligilactobacillus ceti DSM 22408 TaxID=1122146 RepID=A0A0R2KS93_9LACO|nr:ammonia-dependent NAD(+) synthetase [Ligilactobacillus ceti]KRN89053.1 NAD synthetase [Ligilactobacillus ceti DSM 22408]
MNSLQKQIIQELKVQPVIDAQQEIRRSIDFMKAYLLKHPFLKTLVLGISGGQDSTLAGKLCQMAITELRNETQNDEYQFIAVRLPYGIQCDEDDAQAALAFMQPDQVMTVNIKAATEAMVADLKANEITITDFNKGNIKARQRMIAQYGIAASKAGAVVGTDHAAEAITGFYTKFGDGGADITPLWRLNKRQGRELLKWLGAPAELYLKVPTADLEEDRPALPDEQALGVTYDNLDDYLEGRELSSEIMTKIENWYLKTQHKRHLPITVYDDFWK